jgi:hypothetical protein
MIPGPRMAANSAIFRQIDFLFAAKTIFNPPES